MSLPINREQALELLKKYISQKQNLFHCLESEAIMRELARKLNEDEDYWGMLGLLHDIDWEVSPNEKHLEKAPEILKESGFDEEFISTIISHGYGFKELPNLKDKKRTEKVQFALAAAETITGLIYAYALMRGKRISDMKVKGLKKKFKDKTFASGCSREVIKECENLGLSSDESLETSIEGIKKIKDDLGLE